MHCSLVSGLFLGLTVSHSDGVLNPSGVRFGSGEIYSVLERFADIIDDSLCIGQRRPDDEDERVLLFVKMRPGRKFTEQFAETIKRTIRETLSPRHVPSLLFEIEEIPVWSISTPLDNALTLHSTRSILST